jgi:SNF2 family DNA or RNA helicase
LQNGGKALICDEMGLGKTIQAVAVACCFKKEWPVLVIVPALLKHQWAKEFQRWLPELAMDVYITESARDGAVATPPFS